MTQAARWPRPKPGDIVWCRFPEDLGPRPGPKARPALVLAVGQIDGDTAVEVAFGTSQKTNRLYTGEFLIGPQDDDAFRTAGLSYPTKFNLARRVQLPYTSDWFGVAPGTPFGQTPKYSAPKPDAPCPKRIRVAAPLNGRIEGGLTPGALGQRPGRVQRRPMPQVQMPRAEARTGAPAGQLRRRWRRSVSSSLDRGS